MNFRSLFRRSKQPQLTREQILTALPLKNPSLLWEKNEEGRVVITLKRSGSWKAKSLAILFAVPRKRQIVLDEVGTLVWDLCDGETPVRAISQQLMKRYKITLKEAELSLGQFLRTLTQRGFIGLRIEQP